MLHQNLNLRISVKNVLLIPCLCLLLFACTSEIAPGDVQESAAKKEAIEIPGSLEKVDVMPKPTNMMEIRQLMGYPKSAAEKGIEGRVLVEILVDPDGKVAEAYVKEGPQELIPGVADHLDKLTFEPAIKDGKAVASKVVLPFSFKLQ